MKEWKLDAIKLAETNVMSWRNIAKELGVAKSTCSDFLRAYYKERSKVDDDSDSVKKIDEMYPEPSVKVFKGISEGKSWTVKEAHSAFANKVHDNSRILFLSDLHFPYHHKNTFEFLQMLKDRYQPTRIIGLGDELDHHAMSFHDSDPDLFSAGDELKASLKYIKQLEEMFPEMTLLDSNHGSMMFRKSKHHGIPRHYLKSYNEVLGVSDKWQWVNDLVLDLPDGQRVYCHHGKSADAIKTSQAMSMSHVCGHFHEKFGVQYWANPNGLFFAINSGCLIDDSNYAFAYNNTNLKRPLIGTSLIIDGVPILEAMPL